LDSKLEELERLLEYVREIADVAREFADSLYVLIDEIEHGPSMDRDCVRKTYKGFAKDQCRYREYGKHDGGNVKYITGD